MTQLSVIIPTYNESRRLPGSLARLDAYLAAQPYTSEIVVVDNGSQDNTSDAADQFGDHSRVPVYVVALAERGKGRAVQVGMQTCQGVYRMMMDADLAMPPEELPRFFAAMQAGAHVAIGSREGLGARRENEPIYRHLMGRGFNGLVGMLAGLPWRDTQCGFKMFDAWAARLLFEKQTMRGMAFDVEILYLAQRLGVRVAEVAIPWVHDRDSRVRPLADGLEMLGDIIAMRRRHALEPGYLGA